MIGSIVLILLKVNWFGSERIVFTKSSFSVLFVFILLYCIATIVFAFTISALFRKSSIATAVAAFLCFLQITPYVANRDDYAYGDVSKTKKIILSMMPIYALSIGLRIVIVRETFDGVQWSNLFVNYGDDINLGEIFILLIACGTWQVLVVLARKYYKFKTIFETELSERTDSIRLSPKLQRSVTSDSFLKIENLTKVYPNSTKPAVNNLNMSLHEDQITVLLGINAAGKSTTLSMLCGEIKPTSGTVFANGVDLMNSGKINYKSTGVSFQDNILFNNLTVHEHLIFFGQLKGNSESEAENEAQKFMKILNLQPNDYACNLSGGMKRKLCLAIALCADSKFVILDEITSGVDPASRREIWNFLQSVKKNRTIFMSTHYMLEAEVVADKIAILCEGKLKAFGTPFELKQKFSKTCNLACVKRTFCDSQIVTDFVRQSIPNVKISCENASEIYYKFESDEVTKIHEILRRLEDNMEEMHLESFGISSSSMDEVMERQEKFTFKNQSLIIKFCFYRVEDSSSEPSSHYEENSSEHLKTESCNENSCQ